MHGTKYNQVLRFGILYLCLSLLMPTDKNASGHEAFSKRFKTLIEALSDEDRDVRRRVREALDRIGPADVTALIDALKDKDKRVRWKAAEALGRIGPEAKSAIPSLIQALKDEDRTVRNYAAMALGRIGPEAVSAVPALIELFRHEDEWHVRSTARVSLSEIGQPAIPVLIDALKDKDKRVRSDSAHALGRIGQIAVPALIEALKEEDAEFRKLAAFALSWMGAEAKKAVPVLIELLGNKDEKVRWHAIRSLGGIGPVAKGVVSALMKALRDENSEVRAIAASALGEIGPEAKAAVPALIDALRDPADSVRRSSAEALGLIGPDAKAAVPALIVALRGGSSIVENSAAEALGRIGIDAKAAVSALVSALSDSIKYTRESAAEALAKIAAELQDASETVMIKELRAARDAMLSDPNPTIREHGNTVRRSVEFLELLEPKWWQPICRNVLKWVSVHPFYSLFITTYALWIIGWLITFWIRPLALLRINNILKQFNFGLPKSLGGMKVPLHFLLIVGFLNYRLRVLDAWVKANISSFRKRFAEKDTVRNRKIHISVPVEINGKTIQNLTGKHLKPMFEKRYGCLLIWGEGGSGKTSLACRVANFAMSEDQETLLCEHLMLPVLIEHELDPSQSENVLIEATGGQLKDLTGQTEPIPSEMIERLLRYERILVIVDHLSEMSKKTRGLIKPERSDFPANALVVTSRLKETLGGIIKTEVRPLRISGNLLSSFMEAYLTQREKRDLFGDPEFFDACRQLSMMVGDRDITLLLAKLYTEQMISNKERLTVSDLPDNIPDLMLSYLNELNLGVTENRLDDRLVHSDAKVLAWECLKQTFRPTSARYDDVVSALGCEDPEMRLKYLEERLHLIQAVQPTQNRFRFLLDPLAEYLAGLHLLELYGENDESWRKFLTEADAKQGVPEETKGFLLALRDCCITKGKEMRIPDFVEQEVARCLQGSR